MSHVQIDPIQTAQTSCLFYPSGAKSVYMRQRMEDVVRNTRAITESSINVSRLNIAGGHNRTSTSHSNRHATMSRPSTDIPRARSLTSQSGSKIAVEANDQCRKTIPMPKPILYYGRKSDPEAKQLLKSLRLNEGKLEVTVGVKT
jgi:hypothetical protein